MVVDTVYLGEKARTIRKDIIEMTAEAGSGHPGGSLSSADILTALYFGGVLTHDSQNPKAEGRDYFILSKGHAAPVLYATLAEAGYFLRDELLTLRKWGSRLQGHPDSLLLDSIEVSTGSLGQGLSIACGVAAGLRLDRKQNRVFTLLGDGECQEGQVWEAARFAAHQELGNLIAIIDANGLQIDGACDEVCGAGDLGTQFEAFGWQIETVDGHDISALVGILSQAKLRDGSKPQLIVANTLKGKGVSFMEGKADWHGTAPSFEERDRALAELSELACSSELSDSSGVADTTSSIGKEA